MTASCISYRVKKKKLGFWTKLFYGVGNLGYGSTGQTVSSFIMFFGTSVLGLSGMTVGTIIAVTSLWDGLSDPVIGFLSDRTRSKLFGRRLGHMLFASFTLALNNLLLWLCPQGAATPILVIWLLGFLLLQETFNTFFATPYAALCIDIAPDYNDQTKMQGFKTVFYILGLILPSVLMYALMPSTVNGGQGQFDRMGYVRMSLVNSALVILCGLIAIFGTIKRVHSMPNYSEAVTEITDEGKADVDALNGTIHSTNTAALRADLAVGRTENKFLKKSDAEASGFDETPADNKMEGGTQHRKKKHRKTQKIDAKNTRKKSKNSAKTQPRKNKTGMFAALGQIMAGYVETFKKSDFRTVMLGYSVSLIASVFITSVGMHLFTFCFNFSSIQISILMISLFGGAILSQLLWVNIVKKYDKKQTLIFALCVMLFGIAITSVTFLFRQYAPPEKIFWFVLPCLFICGVGSGALYSLPHSMYADVVTMEAFKTGVNNAGRYTGYYTFTYNFSNSIALLFIGFLLDFVGFDSSSPAQSLEVQAGLGKIVFFGSAIALTLAIIIFSNYQLKRADVLKVQIKANEGGKDGN